MLLSFAIVVTHWPWDLGYWLAVVGALDLRRQAMILGEDCGLGRSKRNAPHRTSRSGAFHVALRAMYLAAR